MSASTRRGTTASHHEQALLRAAQNHERRAMEELLRRYEPLIGAIVARLRLPCGCDRCDISQEARIGLLRAICAWEPGRGPFPAFAARCARGQALKALDTAGAHKHQLLSRARSLDSSQRRRQPGAGGSDQTVLLMISREVGESAVRVTLGDRLSSSDADADPERVLLAHEELQSILAALPALTEKERTALAGVLNDKTHQQVADEQGSTRKAVSTALRRARNKLAVPETLAA
jgi:RNA polymerase sigma factor (sigma-70 family)